MKNSIFDMFKTFLLKTAKKLKINEKKINNFIYKEH